MKKILFPMLALVVLAGCSQSEQNDEMPSGAVPILLGADVAASTKAPIATGGTVDAGIAGWETSTEVNYASTPTWHDGLISVEAHPETPKTVTWTTQKYYNADNGITTYLKAWYPRGTVNVSTPESPKVTFENSNGDVDPLLAPVVSGTKSDPTGKTLAFVHKTAQIKFVVKEGTGLADGTTLNSITLKSVQLPNGFDLTKLYNAEDAVTYAAAADFAIKNIGSLTIGTTPEGDAAGDPVMIKPLASNTFTVDVVTSNATYTGKTVTIGDGANVLEGKAYTVTLTFNQIGIDLEATIAEWDPKTGTGTIE